MEEKWNVDLGEENSSGVTPYSARASEPPDMVIVTCKDEGVVGVDGSGRKVWSYLTPSPVHSPVSVGDIDNDGWNEILAADSEGNLVCLVAEGKLKWTSRFRGQAFQWNAPVIMSLDNDRHSRVIIGDATGYLTCFDCDGKLLWEFRADRGRISPISVGDVNGDGSPEIIYGSDGGRVYCISENGKWLWEKDPEEDSPFGRSAPVVADINSDGKMEILIAKSNYSPKQRLYALDAGTGEVLWDFETKLHVYACLASADIDLDGRPEIICGDKANVVYCLDGSGKELWRTPLEGEGIFHGPVLADVNGDGLPEVIVGARRFGSTLPSLYVLSSVGELLESYSVTGRGVISSPAVFDIDGDGRSEILFVATNPARLICLETEGTSEGIWRSYRRTPELTGYVAPHRIRTEIVPIPEKVSKVSIELSELKGPFLGRNALSLCISNPGHEKVLVSFSVEAPNKHFTEMKRTEETRERMDFSFETLHAGEYTLDCSARDPETGAVLDQIERSLSFSPPQEDIDFIKDSMEKLDHLESELRTQGSDARVYLKRKRFELQGRLGDLQDRASNIRSLSDVKLKHLAEELTSLREELTRIQSISEFALKHGSTWERNILVWSPSNPWGPFSYDMAITDGAEPVDAVKVSSYIDEYESFSINITIVGIRSIDLIVSADDLKMTGDSGHVLKASDCLELRETVMVPSIDGKYVPDALPRLDQANRLSIPPWETRQLWVTLQAKEAEAGVYSGKITLRAITERKASLEIPLYLRVYPMTIPCPSRMAFCNWTSAAIKDVRRLDDLLDHYTNIFMAGAPSVLFNPEGEIVQEPDYSQYDPVFKRLKGRVIFLVSGFQNTVRFTEDVPYMSDKWKKAYAKWLKIWVRHLRDIGIGYEDFALYPRDEPGLFKGPIIDAVHEIAKLTKEVDPRVQVYTNPTGGGNAANLKKLEPYIDIWCPNLLRLVRKDREVLQFFKRKGKPVWCYEACGKVKNLHPLDYYRMQPWVAWRHGLDGAGFWTYEYGDLWDRWAQFGLVYDGDGPIPSKRWEAYRDGVEDFNYLSLLKQATKAAESLGILPEQVAKAKKLMEESVATLTRDQDRVDDITRWVEDFPMDFPKLMRYRKEIAEMTVTLTKGLDRHREGKDIDAQ